MEFLPVLHSFVLIRPMKVALATAYQLAMDDRKLIERTVTNKAWTNLATKVPR